MDVTLFNYRISHRGIDGDIAFAFKLIFSGQFGNYIVCANPHSLVVASRDQIFSRALKNANLVLPDGQGILLAAKALNLPIKQRVTGSDFFIGLTKTLSATGGGRYFFLGSTPQVLGSITQRIKKECPNITVCGILSPPYRTEFTDEVNFQMISAVNAAQPDCLWVGMTAPKQEKWIHANRDKLHVPFIGAIGAVFDFYAGTKKRASQKWQRLGLEWLPRFFREPTRLWKRNLVSSPTFLYWIIKEFMKK